MNHNLTNTILNQSPLKFQQTPSSPIRYIHSLTYLSATPSNLSISNEPEHDPTHFYSLSPLKIWYRAHVISRHHVTASHVITWPLLTSSRDRFSRHHVIASPAATELLTDSIPGSVWNLNPSHHMGALSSQYELYGSWFSELSELFW